MTCKFCRVENKTPSCILKMKLKLYICLCTPMTCPQISESTFPSKIPFHQPLKDSSLKCFITMSLG